MIIGDPEALLVFDLTTRPEALDRPLPQFRNQGHCSFLLAARAQEALARGFSLLTVDASPMSRPILEKHSFQYLATSTPRKWRFNAVAN